MPLLAVPATTSNRSVTSLGEQVAVGGASCCTDQLPSWHGGSNWRHAAPVWWEHPVKPAGCPDEVESKSMRGIGFICHVCASQISVSGIPGKHTVV